MKFRSNLGHPNASVSISYEITPYASPDFTNSSHWASAYEGASTTGNPTSLTSLIASYF